MAKVELLLVTVLIQSVTLVALHTAMHDLI
jgi:hypothetical protein